MGKLTWYWHRLCAMSPGELVQHARKKLHARADARATFTALRFDPGSTRDFPSLPARAAAPALLRDALQKDRDELLAGRWRAFGHLELKVDDPPRWHRDYLAGPDLATEASAFSLDHRHLPPDADIKLIWELSRWHALVRLAMAAYVLEDPAAAAKCLDWLEDWVKHNPAFRGWNWTSALEAGLRLIQFSWIDALLGGPGTAAADPERMRLLRSRLLPPHVHFVWRHRSFGSSANNHLLGELAGLILAQVRWPGVRRWSPGLDDLQARWEREVLAQFAGDGGNREQALSYHLFSWELCWQTRMALIQAGRTLAQRTEARLVEALRFFWEVQARSQPWDYGDSDNGLVTPFHLNDATRVSEWRQWAAEYSPSPALEYWLGAAPAMVPELGMGQPTNTREIGGWWFYPESGLAVRESGFWWLRWDLSPLGYLKTAAHGHLDALHLSLWFHDQPIVIDPGTGAYFADPDLRGWLSSREAHNGPCPEGVDYPVRHGPFLWAAHHRVPRFSEVSGVAAVGVLNLPERQVRREVSANVDGSAFDVVDRCLAKNGTAAAFSVRWQFAPGSWVKQISERKFSVHHADVAVMVELGPSWTQVELVELSGSAAMRGGGWDGWVSPAYRQLVRAPCLKLHARPGSAPCLFRTTFQAGDA